jgi:hypothetical protein
MWFWYKKKIGGILVKSGGVFFTCYHLKYMHMYNQSRLTFCWACLREQYQTHGPPSESTQCNIQKLDFQKLDCLHEIWNYTKCTCCKSILSSLKTTLSAKFHYFDGVYTTVSEINNHEFDTVLSNKLNKRSISLHLTWLNILFLHINNPHNVFLTVTVHYFK